jgi:HSP20 family protein
LPGFDKKNLKLKVNEDHVSVKAEQDERKHSSSKVLPCPVDPSTAKATYRNGVLDIKVLKVEVSKGVDVSIK